MIAVGAALLVAAITALVLALAGTDASESASNALATGRNEFGPALTTSDAESESDHVPPATVPTTERFYVAVKGLGDTATIDRPDCVASVQQITLRQLEAVVMADLGGSWSAFALSPSPGCDRVRMTVRGAPADTDVQITGRLGRDGLSDVQCKGVTCRVNSLPARRATLINVG